VGQAAYGLVKPTKGKVMLNAENLEIENAMFSLKHRIAYVPKDRDAEALMMATTILHNFCMPSLEEISGKFGYVSAAQMRKMSNDSKAEYNVKCTSVDQNMNGLSGGNKQKVNLGRWLMKDLQLLIIDCPTRGVDVGVKAYIYHVMNEAKKKGLTMLLITDELTEAMGMADNIVVMKDGAVKSKIGRSSHFSEEKMIEEMI
jgi:ribose transport system ATP-binding protein